MYYRAEVERRIGERTNPKTVFFMKVVRRKFQDHPRMYHSFLLIMSEYTYGRIEHGDMYKKVSRLFWEYPVIIKGFSNSFPQPMSTKDDDVETPRTDKNAEVEDDSSKAIPVASCSSSPPSGPGNAAQAYEAEKKEAAQSEGRTLYVTGTNAQVIEESEAYQHIAVLVNQIRFNRIDTYAIMDYASHVLQGYPELIENFNIFLPDGYKIVVLSDDHEINTS